MYKKGYDQFINNFYQNLQKKKHNSLAESSILLRKRKVYLQSYRRRKGYLGVVPVCPGLLLDVDVDITSGVLLDVDVDVIFCCTTFAVSASGATEITCSDEMISEKVEVVALFVFWSSKWVTGGLSSSVLPLAKLSSSSTVMPPCSKAESARRFK